MEPCYVLLSIRYCAPLVRNTRKVVACSILILQYIEDVFPRKLARNPNIDHVQRRFSVLYIYNLYKHTHVNILQVKDKDEPPS